MKEKITIESSLSPIDGYLLTLKRNTEYGWYELEVGIPAKWSYSENEYIGVEVLHETEEGKLIRVFPKNDDIIVDNLVEYVSVVLSTNKMIEEKEKEFQQKLEIMKEEMVRNASDFYKDLDNIKKTSFEKVVKVEQKPENNGQESE